MRPVMLLLALLALAGSAHAQDWTTIPLGTTAELYAVENTNLAPRWVVGAGGFAALSNAARTTWTRMAPGTTAALYSVAEPIPGEVWMGAGQGVVRIRGGWLWVFAFQAQCPSGSMRVAGLDFLRLAIFSSS